MRNTLYWLAAAVFMGSGCDPGTEERPAGARSEQDIRPIQPGAIAPGQSRAADDPDLWMEAAPLEEAYYRDGPMMVELTFHNAADSMVVFRPVFYFGAWLDAEIVDSAGRPVARTMEISPPSPSNTLETFIRPRQSITVGVDLRCVFPTPEIPCDGPYDALSEPGVYEVRMRFELPCDGCQTLFAEPFEVCVVEQRRPLLSPSSPLLCRPQPEFRR